MTYISYEAFRVLEARNSDGLDLGGLTVVIPWGTTAVVTGKAYNGTFQGAEPGAHSVFGMVPEPAPRDEAALAELCGFVLDDGSGATFTGCSGAPSSTEATT